MSVLMSILIPLSLAFPVFCIFGYLAYWCGWQSYKPKIKKTEADLVAAQQYTDIQYDSLLARLVSDQINMNKRLKALEQRNFNGVVLQRSIDC